jgi:hemin uptake protein HemP
MVAEREGNVTYELAFKTTPILSSKSLFRPGESVSIASQGKS